MESNNEELKTALDKVRSLGDEIKNIPTDTNLSDIQSKIETFDSFMEKTDKILSVIYTGDEYDNISNVLSELTTEFNQMKERIELISSGTTVNLQKNSNNIIYSMITPNNYTSSEDNVKMEYKKEDNMSFISLLDDSSMEDQDDVFGQSLSLTTINPFR